MMAGALCHMWHDAWDVVSHVILCLGRCVICDMMPGTLCQMWRDAWDAVSHVTWWLGRCVTCDMMAGTLCHMWHDGSDAVSYVTWWLGRCVTCDMMPGTLCPPSSGKWCVICVLKLHFHMGSWYPWCLIVLTSHTCISPDMALGHRRYCSYTSLWSIISTGILPYHYGGILISTPTTHIH